MGLFLLGHTFEVRDLIQCLPVHGSRLLIRIAEGKEGGGGGQRYLPFFSYNPLSDCILIEVVPVGVSPAPLEVGYPPNEDPRVLGYCSSSRSHTRLPR